MNAKDVIQTLFRTNDFMVNEYLKDLSDADLLTRPVPEANHIAWQLGHLINSEVMLLQMVPGTTAYALPPGWADQYSKPQSRTDSPAGFLKKADYLEMYKKVRGHSAQAIAGLPDAVFDKATEGRMASFAPTIGSLVVMIANHPMMHVGQWVVLRRKLGKPIVI